MFYLDRSRRRAPWLWLAVLATACGGSASSGGLPRDGNPGLGEIGSPDASQPDGAGPPGPTGGASASAEDAGEDVMFPSSDDASSQIPGEAEVGDSTDGAASCVMTFPPVTDFGSPGPYDVAIDCSPPTTITADGTGCTIYHPTTMGEDGLKHPVIVWGNGTAAPPECNGDAHVFGEYDWLLNQWASEGFIVVSANTDSTGNGTDMLDCLD